MTLTMKSVLDDAAEQATADLTIDLALVRQRAGRERSRSARLLRQRTGIAALSVAAVAGMIAILLPVGSVLGVRVLPAGEPALVPAVTGIPANWYYAPVWTPPVTRHPMGAAVMVLSAPLVHGPTADGGTRRGPVLVSADARRYASITGWGSDDGGVTLIADGTKVAWWTAPRDGPVVVHLLTLRNGVQHDVTIGQLTPSSMIWRLGDVYFSGRAGASGGSPGTYRISADGRTRTKICGCAPALLGTDGRDRLKQSLELQANAIPDAGAFSPGQLDPTAEAESGRIAAPALLTSWDGLLSASVQRANGRWIVQLRGSDGDYISPSDYRPSLIFGGWPLTSDEPIFAVKALGWTAAGIVLQVNTRKGPSEPIHRSIRVMDPQTGTTTVVARPHETSQTIPVAIATSLVQTAMPIPGPPVSFDARDRAHLSFLTSVAWSQYGFWIRLATGVLIAGLAALVVWRLRRRGGPALHDQVNSSVKEH